MLNNRDALTTYPRPLVAANDDSMSSAAQAQKPDRTRSGGWDPYEVWRTRIKEARDTADREQRSP